MATLDGHPQGFGERGTELWTALRESRPFNAAEVVVLQEMCRAADRLDKLDLVLSGDVDVWCRLETRHDGRKHEIEVTLDEGLAEARQLAMTFQRLAGSLNLPEVKPETKDGINDLAARRAKRQAG